MAISNTAEARAEREAADWFVRLNSRAISTAALEAFHAWRHEPRNDAAYGRMEALWEASGRLRGMAGAEYEIAAALARGARRRRWRDRLRSALVPVAGAALAAATALYVASAAQVITYRTPVGEQRLVALADGTRVRLDTDTEIKVRLGPSERDVRLTRGQAFFDVAHDGARPFLVKADGVQVRAVGTRFDIRLNGGRAHVTLVEGVVEVTHSAAGRTQRWRLAPGQALAPGPASSPTAVDTESATSWTSGQLVFHATPLADAVAEVNRYSRVKIVLDDRTAATAPVNGKFDAGDTEAFVAAVCDLFDLAPQTLEGREIRLRPRS